MAASDGRFANLGTPNSIWAIGAIHGDCRRLERIHKEVGRSLSPGDSVVYLGNIIGVGDEVAETLNAILDFRARAVESGVGDASFVCLRGQQEEMWHKLMQLHYAPNPTSVLSWMLEHGLQATVQAYGGRIDEGQSAARMGPTNLNRWISGLRQEMHRHAGHDALFAALRRAAFTEPASVLLVSAGIEPDRPIASQGDSLWWGHPGFDEIDEPIEGFSRIVRGFDPANAGQVTGPITATVDGGCGRGGRLIAAQISPEGEIVRTLEA